MKLLIIGGTGPTGSFMVEELLSRGHQVTLYHTGAHEVELSSAVEHIHGDPRELGDLQRDLGGKGFDAAVNTAGRIRYVLEVLRGRVGKLMAISGMGVYRDLYAGMPVPIPEEATRQTAHWLREHPPAAGDLDSRYFQQSFDYEEEDRIVRRLRA